MTMAGFLEHCKRVGFRPGAIFDVGVATGTCEIYDSFPGVPLLLVEPVPDFEPVLKELARVYGAEYVLAAASDRSGTTMLHFHTDNLDSSSLMREVEGEQVDGVAREVRTVTLDELAPAHKLPKPYLVKVDVQGAELEVLGGAQKVLADSEVVILETSLFGVFIDGPQLYDVVRYMKERGFVAYDVFGPYYRPLDMALGQVDVAFVKEQGDFRKRHGTASPEQRATLLRHNNIPEALAELRARPAVRR
jgi:FkbM family methyltransferase